MNFIILIIISYPTTLISDSTGYYFGDGSSAYGVLRYQYPSSKTASQDEIRMEVITRQMDGVLLKLVSEIFADYIELKLVCEKFFFSQICIYVLCYEDSVLRRDRNRNFELF